MTLWYSLSMVLKFCNDALYVPILFTNSNQCYMNQYCICSCTQFYETRAVYACHILSIASYIIVLFNPLQACVFKSYLQFQNWKSEEPFTIDKLFFLSASHICRCHYPACNLSASLYLEQTNKSVSQHFTPIYSLLILFYL
jgi:hypothetical protein